MKEVPVDVAVLALQRLFEAFTGLMLPVAKAKELLEQTKKEGAR